LVDNTPITAFHTVKSVALQAIGLFAIGYFWYLTGDSPFLLIGGVMLNIGLVWLAGKTEEIHIRKKASEQQAMLEQIFGGHAAWENLPSLYFDELPLYSAGERGESARAAVRARMNTPIAKVFYKWHSHASAHTLNVAIKLRDQNRGVEAIVLLSSSNSPSWMLRIPEAHAFLDHSLPVIMETQAHWSTLQAMIEGRHPRFGLAR
jgi:hypothetical protein